VSCLTIWLIFYVGNFSSRTKFEEDSLRTIQERLQTLATTSDEHTAALTKLAASKSTAQAAIDQMQNAIEALQEELQGFREDLEEKTSALDDVKRTAGKASKALDKALKDIAAKVCNPFSLLQPAHMVLERRDRETGV
jgi:structural maintenance of chromosome 1